MQKASLISFLFFILLSITLTGCSSVSKKDCTKDMFQLGLDHGKAGSAIKHTDDLRRVCFKKDKSVDLEQYEKGFTQGWLIYCLPNRAFELGKKGETYVSFCPKERESVFREKYLLGKRINDMNDVMEELNEKIEEIKSNGIESVADQDELNRLEKEFSDHKRQIQALEQEGQKSTIIFSNPI